MLLKSRFSYKCHAIASPSLSSSLANQTFSVSLTYFFKSLMIGFFSVGTTYLGWKLFSTSTPSSLTGRSEICPTQETTLKSCPRIFSIVLALGLENLGCTLSPLSFVWLSFYQEWVLISSPFIIWGIILLRHSPETCAAYLHKTFL